MRTDITFATLAVLPESTGSDTVTDTEQQLADWAHQAKADIVALIESGKMPVHEHVGDSGEAVQYVTAGDASRALIGNHRERYQGFYAGTPLPARLWLALPLAGVQGIPAKDTTPEQDHAYTLASLSAVAPAPVKRERQPFHGIAELPPTPWDKPSKGRSARHRGKRKPASEESPGESS